MVFAGIAVLDTMRRGEDQVGRHEAAAAKELRTFKERDQERVVVVRRID